METPLVVVACSVFKPELTALADQGRLPFRVRFTDSGLHMYPQRLELDLRSLVHEERSSGSQVLLVYGDCTARMAELGLGRGVVRTSGASCGEILLGKESHKALLKSRALLLLPEWTERWKEILLRLPGVDADLARTMIQDLYTRFVYLDTGVRPVPHDALTACSAFFDRPHEVAEASLDRLENTIRQAIEHLPRSAADEVESLGKTRATAVMMLDIVTATLEHSSGLSGVALALCQKLRELTGAKVSALLVPTAPSGSRSRTGPRALAVSPARHAGLLRNEAVQQLFEQSLELERTVTLLPAEQKHRGTELPGLLPGLAMPLKSGSERVGAIVSLGLLDPSFADSIMEIERILSGALSVVLKNALLREDQRQLVGQLEREVIERKQAEETLRSSEAQVRLLLESTAEAIFGIDLHGICTFANPACVRMLGYAEPSDLLGRNMHELLHHSSPDGQPLPLEACGIHRAMGRGQGTHRDDEILWRRDGTSFPVEYWSHPQIHEGEVVGAVVTFIDITRRKLAEEEIRHLATHDALTGLPSLRLAKDRLSMAVHCAHRNKTLAAAMFIDLDGFKAVNDGLGHEAGDAVLAHVARVVGAHLRETDTFARIGGDEFLLVAADLKLPEGARVVAERILDVIATPVMVRGEQVSVGASIGIALYPRDGLEPESLIKAADIAMYEVKKTGKNGFGFAS
ncbi:MAG: diguanylate cyclase [Polyangiaceae bacterium]|nr:diguanylate cyclase [Polyangiaceae bacterium]